MNREEALDVALGQIERAFGKGSVMKMSDQAQVQIGAISTGSLVLDLALGIGGLPRGRVVEIFGPESSGKTTLVYHVIAEAQRRGGICAFIDAEHAMDPQYARKIGVNVDDLLVSQPDTGEQALEITELLVRSGALDVVAVDSVAALTPKAEIEGEMGDSHVGLQARLMSQALRKLAGTLNRTDTICLFTNQLREKIGVMFGSPETTPGGRALKFYSSVRLDIRRIETLKDGAEAFGNRVRVKVVKNKVAPPFKQAEFDIIYGSGISWESTVLDVGIEQKIVAEVGLVLQLRRRAARPGAPERGVVPEASIPTSCSRSSREIQAAGARSRRSPRGCCRASRRQSDAVAAIDGRGRRGRRGRSRKPPQRRRRPWRRRPDAVETRRDSDRALRSRDRSAAELDGAARAARRRRGGADPGARAARPRRLRRRRAFARQRAGTRRARLRRRADPRRPRAARYRGRARRGSPIGALEPELERAARSSNGAAGAQRRRATSPRAASARRRSRARCDRRTEKR